MVMEWYWALGTLIGMVMFFMAMGVPVALTFITTNIIGVVIFMGDIAGWLRIAGWLAALFNLLACLPGSF